MRSIVKPILVSLGTFLVVGACGDDDEFDNTVDCARICARFNECVADIDVSECTDLCEDDASASSAIEQQADSCEDCIEDSTCAEAEPCWESCPVVPVIDG